MFRALIFAAAVTLGLSDAILAQEKTEVPSIESLAWMAGHWRGTEDGTTTDEIWMAPAGGMMPGINRGVDPNMPASFENLQILQKRKTIVYVARPAGGDEILFPAKEIGEQSVIFENPDYDFPQRIIYRRENDQMTARIEGNISGQLQAMEWHWKLVQPEPDAEKNTAAKKTDQEKPMLHGLRTAVYKVDDLDKAKKWYSETLGIKPYFDEPFYVGFNVGGFELGLDPDMEGVTRGNNQPVYWGVDDCKKTFAELQKRGAQPNSEPQEVGGGIIVATILDPFGNIFGIIENPHFKMEK